MDRSILVPICSTLFFEPMRSSQCVPLEPKEPRPSQTSWGINVAHHQTVSRMFTNLYWLIYTTCHSVENKQFVNQQTIISISQQTNYSQQFKSSVQIQDKPFKQLKYSTNPLFSFTRIISYIFQLKIEKKTTLNHHFLTNYPL